MKVTAYEKREKDKPLGRPSVYPYNFVPLGTIEVPDWFESKIIEGDSNILGEVKELYNNKGIGGCEVELGIRPKKGRGKFKRLYRGLEL